MINISALVPLIVAQTGALIFFAGVVAFTMKDHARRIEKTEDKCERCSITVARLAQKEGLS